MNCKSSIRQFLQAEGLFHSKTKVHSSNFLINFGNENSVLLHFNIIYDLYLLLLLYIQ